MIWAFLLFCIVTGVALGMRSRALIQAAYYEGYRRAIKDAVGIVKSESQRGFENPQPGYIMETLRCASLIGDIGDKIRDLAKQIGRPIGN